MTKLVLILFVFLWGGLYAQKPFLKNHWYTIGPIEEPSPNSSASSKGIGPVEFIRATPLQEGLILAGSLNGGLFSTSDGGENWISAGSDNWKYSSATWADFYPKDQTIWFASSTESESNGKPGRLGQFGGIYRTNDKGVNWKQIADYTSFNAQESIVIYGYRFHPSNSKMMYVLTSSDIYFTKNCLADKVIWEHETKIGGMFYDMDFIENSAYITGVQHGKWHVYYTQNDDYKKIEVIESFTESITQITIEPHLKDLLILVDYNSGADKLYLFSPTTNKLTELSRSQRVTFGAGHTFAVNPHAPNEIYLGVSTRLRRWNFTTKSFENLGSDYHVDVEFVTFDPFDPNKIYMATHGGFFISYDKGESWDNKSYGMGIAEVLGMDVGVSDPYEVVIGTFHDGSMVYADWKKNGHYYWENVNGGDALIPLINPKNAGEVYTSNQYTGGGIYYSKDTAKNITNIHNTLGLTTSGWQMAASLHPTESNYLFLNHYRKNKEVKGNIDVVRTNDPTKRLNVDFISDFKQTHQLDSYKVYGLYTSKYHPNVLMAYVLHYETDENGKSITNHKLFRTLESLDSAGLVSNSWHELELPRNSWVADVVVDHKNKNKLYISYMAGVDGSEEYPNETGMIYYLKYRKRNNNSKRNIDISLNIPSDLAGKYNLVYTTESDKYVFIGTRNGIYMGNKYNLKGGGNWREVGFGLPHCKVYGLHYDESLMLLTVGLKGRGVWRISLREPVLESTPLN